MTGRTNAASPAEGVCELLITGFASFTAYYNDGQASSVSPIQAQKDSIVFVKLDMGGPGGITEASGAAEVLTNSFDRYGAGYSVLHVSGDGEYSVRW